MLYVPDPTVLEAGARGLIGAVAGDGDLTDAQRRSMQAVLTHAFGSELELDRLAPLDADSLAAVVVEPTLRKQLVDAMIALWMMAHPPDEPAYERIMAYAKALDVDEGFLRVVRQQVEGHRKMVLLDYLRASWHGEEMRRLLREQPGSVLRQVGALVLHHEDTALVERWRGLADLPEGTWGHELHRFYDRHGFLLPGQAGSPPELITYHDWVHVLAQYDAVPVGEILIGGFMAANVHRESAFSGIMLPMMIYEVGVIPDNPVIDAHVGSLEAAGAFDAFGDALRRGRETPVDLLNMDHWAMAEVPIDEARAQLQLAPKGAHSIADFPDEAASSGR